MIGVTGAAGPPCGTCGIPTGCTGPGDPACPVHPSHHINYPTLPNKEKEMIKPCPLCNCVVSANPPDHSIRMDGDITCHNCDLTIEIGHVQGRDLEVFQEAVQRWNQRKYKGD